MSQGRAANHSKQCSLPSTLSKQKSESLKQLDAISGLFFFFKGSNSSFVLANNGRVSWLELICRGLICLLFHSEMPPWPPAVGPGPWEAICPASPPKAASVVLLSFLTCLPKWFLKISNAGGSTTTSGNLCVFYINQQLISNWMLHLILLA